LLSGCAVAAKREGIRLLVELSTRLPGIWVAGTVHETAVIYNANAQQVELHYAINQRNVSPIENMTLRVARDGKEVDVYDCPDDLAAEVAIWSVH
jgi:hypothetical protein